MSLTAARGTHKVRREWLREIRRVRPSSRENQNVLLTMMYPKCPSACTFFSCARGSGYHNTGRTRTFRDLPTPPPAPPTEPAMHRARLRQMPRETWSEVSSQSTKERKMAVRLEGTHDVVLEDAPETRSRSGAIKLIRVKVTH